MSASAFVLACALDLLGRSAGQFAPIRIIDTPPQGVSTNAQGFVDPNERVIYLLASAPSFREAVAAEKTARGRCAARRALKMIASVILHEEWHLAHGPDERSAYEAQLTALNRLGLGMGTWEFRDVTRSLHAVERRRRH